MYSWTHPSLVFDDYLEHAQYHVDIDLNQANIVKLYIVIVSNINMWMEV